MSEKKNPGELNDDLIRVALYQELESVKPPPVGKSWARIETGLNRDHGSTKRHRSKWPGYAAAAAAALLVIALSSMGILQVPDPASPALEDQAPVRTADDEMEALQVEDFEEADEENNNHEPLAEEEAVYELPPFAKKSDPSPPDWREALPENLFFEEAVLLSAGQGPFYHGAIYFGAEARLLWVKSKVEEEEPPHFIEHLGEHIQVELRQTEEINGYIFIKAAGQPGLAWQTTDRNQALLVISGEISAEQLINIAAEID